MEGKVFSHCVPQGMPKLVERYRGSLIPSRAFADGGIHEAIEQYEDVRSSMSCWRRSWPCGIWTVSPDPGELRGTHGADRRLSL